MPNRVSGRREDDGWWSITHVCKPLVLAGKDGQRLESRRRLLTRMHLGLSPRKHPRRVSLPVLRRLLLLGLGVGRDVWPERRCDGVREGFLGHDFFVGLAGCLVQGIGEEYVFRARFGRDDDLAFALVCQGTNSSATWKSEYPSDRLTQGVHQVDQPSRLILMSQIHIRRLVDDDRLEIRGDRDVIRRAESFLAQVGKGELGDLVYRPGNLDFSTIDVY